MSCNIRLRWEYQPGRELFIVCSEQRDNLAPRSFAQLENRAFIVSEPKAFDKKRLEE